MRNLTDPVDGVLAGKTYVIDDRDPLFTAEFLRTLEAAGVKSVKFPPRSPNLNPHAEGFVRSIKESCLDRLIFFGEASRRTAVQNFVEHYLPLRAESSGPREPDHLPGGGPPGSVGCHPAPSATGRHAELLLPRPGLIGRLRPAIAVRLGIQAPEVCAASGIGASAA